MIIQRVRIVIWHTIFYRLAAVRESSGSNVASSVRTGSQTGIHECLRGMHGCTGNISRHIQPHAFAALQNEKNRCTGVVESFGRATSSDVQIPPTQPFATRSAHSLALSVCVSCRSGVHVMVGMHNFFRRKMERNVE